MFYRENEFDDILQNVVLVPYSSGYKLGDFDCGIDDYNNFLTNDARYYTEQNISQVRLLIHKQTADIISYVALSTDSFLLDKEEKQRENIDIPINSIPALKIGKLAVDRHYKDKPYGSFMLWLALGVLEQINETGVGCRFLVVDADITQNPSTPQFYEKNDFVHNEKENKNRTRSVSMRYDVFQG